MRASAFQVTVDDLGQVAPRLDAPGQLLGDGHAAVAAALETAARLTPEPAAKAERLVEAAEAAWVLGDAPRTLAMRARDAPR